MSLWALSSLGFSIQVFNCLSYSPIPCPAQPLSYSKSCLVCRFMFVCQVLFVRLQVRIYDGSACVAFSYLFALSVRSRCLAFAYLDLVVTVTPHLLTFDVLSVWVYSLPWASFHCTCLVSFMLSCGVLAFHCRFGTEIN